MWNRTRKHMLNASNFVRVYISRKRTCGLRLHGKEMEAMRSAGEWKERLRMLRPRSQTVIRQRDPSLALQGLAKKRTLQIASVKPPPWSRLESVLRSEITNPPAPTIFSPKFFVLQSLRHENCRIISIFERYGRDASGNFADDCSVIVIHEKLIYRNDFPTSEKSPNGLRRSRVQ